MPMETRSSNALFKRAEQLKRWEESDTNKAEPFISESKATRIKFSDGCVFLAACAAGDKDEVERLINNGADIDTANVDGLTALHQACIDDNLDMVEFLVEQQCDLNRGDNEGWTPLHATASCGFVSIARYLIEKGADVAAVNNDGDLPIDIGESGEIEQLLQAEINRLAIDCDAVRLEEERVMLEHAKQWLNAGKIDEIVHPKTSATALHVSAAKGYIKVMSILLKAGTDLNQQDIDGWTALHAAAHWGQREACEMLAEGFANMDIQNFAGQTCFDVADPDLVKLLEELKKKQATISKGKPEIQEILQRVAPPPLKRRTSVTRMSGADKSNVVTKDASAERVDIEKRLRLDDVEEEDKSQLHQVKKEPLRLDRIPEVPNKIEEKPKMDSPTLQQATPIPCKIEKEVEKVLPEKIPEPVAPIAVKVEVKEADTITTTTTNAEKKTVQPVESTIIKPKNVEPTLEKLILPSESEIQSRLALDDNETSPTEDFLPGQIRRVFTAPTRDDESEAQRKAHAKRVRETRRSTQGVTLEDLKSAEQQLLRKQQEEDERKEREKDLAKDPKPTKVVEKEPKIIAPVSETAPAVVAQLERKQPWRSTRTADLESETPVVLRRPLSDLNHTSTVPDEDSAVHQRARQRPVSAPPTETTTTTSAPTSVTIPLRARSKQDDVTNEEDEKRDREKSGDEKPQSGQQRRRRPKRRSTGVVYLDGADVPGSNDVFKNNGEETPAGQSATAENEDNGQDRYRSNRSSRPLADSRDNTPSRLSDQSSRNASLNSSTSSLNDDGEKDYKKLYIEVRDENERLKSKLKKSEDELDSTKRQLDKLLQNNKNSLSDAEKREKRALERRLSEMEEESKEMEILFTDNQRLKDENAALIRVISKLSK